MPWHPEQYGPVFAPLLASQRRLVLAPHEPEEAVRPQLEHLTVARAFAGMPVSDPEAARACLAGAWLYFDFLDESHTISQDLPTAEGSYWHALMHRREQDFSNSKYWFRRVGTHPIFPELARQVAAWIADTTALPREARFLAAPAWDPYVFVDFCAAAVRGRADLQELGENVQRAEWQLLFDHCFHRATGT